jgi:hypothetical protein
MIRRIAYLSVGFIPAITVIIAPIFFTGGLAQLWEYAFVYNRYYVSFIGFAYGSMVNLFGYIFPFILLCVWFVIRRLKHWIFFFGICITSILNICASQLLHYYIILLPTLALMAAVALVDLAEKLISLRTRREKDIFIIGTTISVIALLAIPFSYIYTASPNQISEIHFDGFPFVESVLLAKILKEDTSKNDTVFIWGNEPQILYYADRRSATQFVILDPIVISTPFREIFTQTLLSELSINHPKAIITEGFPPSQNLLNSDSLPEPTVALAKLTANNYTLAGGTFLTHDGTAIFSTSTSTLHKNHASLLLFLRND